MKQIYLFKAFTNAKMLRPFSPIKVKALKLGENLYLYIVKFSSSINIDVMSIISFINGNSNLIYNNKLIQSTFCNTKVSSLNALEVLSKNDFDKNLNVTLKQIR